MFCNNCNVELTNKNGKLFCSRSCSASYNNKRRKHSEETKEKIRQSVKANPGGYALTKLGGKLSRKNYIKKPKTVTGPRGGLRERSGRGKSGHYQGFFLNSTYELAYIIYCLDHNIAIERNTKFWNYIHPITGNSHKYYPDFIVSGKLIEVKGYMTDIVRIKISAVNEPIQLLLKDDLKDIFKYVQEKTNLSIDKLYLLYD